MIFKRQRAEILETAPGISLRAVFSFLMLIALVGMLLILAATPQAQPFFY